MSLRLLQLTTAASLILTTTSGQAQGVGWALVNWKVRHDFPTISRITTAEVARLLEDNTQARPLLLDVRTTEEFEVSHLPGACRVEPGADPASVNLTHDIPIITYCSVGYRSGAFARKLQQAGYKDVRNMAGSIFQWANEGRPLERGGVRVTQVHPYNRTWGKLLKPELRAELPKPHHELKPADR